MIDFRGFSAWITCDDMELAEFEPRFDEKNHTVTCWIAGPVGKAFIVHWRDHGSQIDSASYIYFDGFKVSGQFLFGYGEELRRGIRVGPEEDRPFVFSHIEADDMVGFGNLKPHKNVGSIMLEIKQVQRMESYDLPQARAAPPVIRGHRPEGEVIVKYGETRPAPVQKPTWKIRPHDPNNPGPFVTFIFRYRTHGCSRPMKTKTRTNIPMTNPPTMQRTTTTHRPKSAFRLIPNSRRSTNINPDWGLPPVLPRLMTLLATRRISTRPRPSWAAQAHNLRVAGPTREIRTLTLIRLQAVSARYTSLRGMARTAAATLLLLTAAFMSSVPLSTLPTYASSSTSRLKSLYSDFTYQKQSNPTSYASNVEWWRRTLEDMLLRGWLSDTHNANATPDRIVLHATGVAFTEHFRFEGVGKPLSIPTVIVSQGRADTHRSSSLVKSELCGSKGLIPLADFLNASRTIYDPGWLPYRIASFVVGKPLWWALGQLGVVDTQASAFGDSGTAERWKKAKGDYVAVKLLEQAAERILERQRQKSTGNFADALYNADSFREEFAGCAFEHGSLSDLDVKVLLKFLERDKRAIVVIKFVEQGTAESFEVTAVDSGLLALKTAVQKLQAQVDGLQRRIDERTRLASDALRQKRKETALTQLRARKQLEDVHKKRLGSLDLLEATLLRVETSAGDIDIMRSYESSTATLREILSHELLQRDKIDETMDALASANADAREVDSAIQLGAEMAQADADVDDDALEAELRALVLDVETEKGEAAAEERRRRLAADELSAPAHSPVPQGTPQTTEAQEQKKVAA
ncbi:uncharacterized protein TRAVEDRAFT_145680 [Trametes versicolor FP-101664 SS1]|uniref:uncharacterized protein n=1 Tax=Trametes versicolor (strain FP-101664) TaxID=717944 RepID=UPI0004623EE0|nr:uncharacterized protein TRAVEDRAFT_145680 [Trametes versicolor FP-101664 SS1]EIW60360.1 hypothetical protein TRAVEDRAFT_145680 [Trametes versicolor FP-101664 SS1]